MQTLPKGACFWGISLWFKRNISARWSMILQTGDNCELCNAAITFWGLWNISPKLARAFWGFFATLITWLSQPEADGTALNRSPYVRITFFPCGTSEKIISDLTATSVLFERIFLQQYGLATLLSTSCFVWLKITWLTHESWFLLTTCSHGGIHRGFHGQAVPHGGLSSKAGFL